MNGYQRIRAALAGEWPDVVPVMLHNFMMAAHEAGVTMREYRSDPEALARCFIQSVEKYGYDGVLVDVDTAVLAGALGVPLDLPEDAPARCLHGSLASLDAVWDLEPVNVSAYPRVQVWLEAVRLLLRQFGDEVYIRGNCDQCPFSLASMMRAPDQWLMDVMQEENEPAVRRLLDHCAGATTQFLKLMAETGAHMVSNGDSPAGPDMSSPRLYRCFAMPYEKRVAAHARELGVPYVLHICGKTDRILSEMAEIGADGLELDYKTDVQLAHDILKDRAVFIGNIDPNAVLAMGTPGMVEEATAALMEVFADTPRFILNAGCAIPSTTPPENLRAMIRTARGRY